MQNLKTKTLVLILLGLIVAGGLGYGGYRLLTKEKPEENGSTNQSTQSATTQYTWQTYHNDEFGFSFEYPNEISDTALDYENHKWKLFNAGIIPSNVYNISISNKYNAVNILIAKKGITEIMPTLEKNDCTVIYNPDITSYSNINLNSIIAGEEAYLVEKDPIMTWNSQTQKNDIPERQFYSCLEHEDMFFEIHYSQSPSIQFQEDLVFKRLLETFKFDDLEHKVSLPNLDVFY